MAGSWTNFRPASTEGYTDFTTYGIVCYKNGETFEIEYTDTSKVGQNFELIVGYDNEESWIGETIATKTGTVPASGKCQYSIPLTSIDYSISNRIQGYTDKGSNQAFLGVFIYFNDEYASEKHFAVWNPEAFVSASRVYRSDNTGNPFDSGEYITYAGHIGFDLPNSEISSGYVKDAFLPTGKYTFSAFSGTAEDSEVGYITNQGTEESYQNGRNGYDIKITLSCTGFDFSEIQCVFKAEILKDIDSDAIFYESEDFIYTFSDSPLYLSSKNRGVGIGGPPVNGNEADSSFEIYWNAYFHRDVHIDGKRILDFIYPVGSIYISTNGVSPTNLFGGIWKEIEGRFLLGASVEYPVGSEGGSANSVVVSHTHSTPAHSHTIGGGSCTASSAGNHRHVVYAKVYDRASGGVSTTTPQNSSGNNNRNSAYAGTHSHPVPAHSHTVSGGSGTTGAASGGVSGSGKNMPPYLSVNIWERIA